MSIEVLSTSVYGDIAKAVAKPRVDTTTGTEGGTVPINIIEVPTIGGTGTGSPTGKDTGNGQKDPSQYDKQIKNAISNANSKLKTHRTRCEFSYNEELKRVSIKVLDDETQEVIKEIPAEDTLEMLARMYDLAGILIDEKR